MTPDEIVQQPTSSYAVVIFSKSDCCMSDVLCQFSGTNQPIPAVFIGGKFIGGVDSLITYHLDNKLVPHLKEAGALWL
ncbi:Thioredoxin-like superfamily [Sesbania bispinosa]|nr:Thioredoxin-like superfamily [Sesbania bispinosa]